MSETLDPETLTPGSREFFQGFVARFPLLSAYCRSRSCEGVPGQHLWIEIPSPAGRDRGIQIWMEGGEEPSLAFGEAGWHVHDNHVRWREGIGWEEESLLDLVDAILHDQVVVFTVAGSESPPFGSVLDLRDPDALVDELTCPVLRAERILLRTFTGAGDREVSPGDLEA